MRASTQRPFAGTWLLVLTLWLATIRGSFGAPARSWSAPAQCSLEESRLSQPYQRQLSIAYRALHNWILFENAAAIDCWYNQAAEANIFLTRFIQHCYDMNINFNLAKHAVLATQTYHRELKGHLHRSWDLLKSWRLLLPVNNRIPMPLELLKTIFLAALEIGLSSSIDGGLWLAFAVLCRVGFYALLRTSELINLLVSDIRFVGQTAIIAIKDPKNRAFMGRCQFAIIRDIPTIDWLRWLATDVEPCLKLWPSSAQKFAAMLKTMFTCLNISLNITIGSLRPGGTTHYFVEGLEVSRIKFLGRWANEASLGHYIQEAMSSLVWNSIDPRVAHQLHFYFINNEFAWHRPIKIPASLFTALVAARVKQWKGLMAHRLATCSNEPRLSLAAPSTTRSLRR